MEKLYNKEQEIPQGLLSNIISWLRGHKHTDEEIVDCILYICGE